MKKNDQKKGVCLKGILRCLLMAATCLSSFLLGSSIRCQAVNVTYDSALDAVYTNTYKDIFYNKVAGSPLEAETEEGVDTATGHLWLARTDLSLKGTGGMDFNLNRYYDSSEANIGRPAVESVDKLHIDTFNVEFDTGMGSTHKIAVAAAILNKHRDALEGMLVSYDKDSITRRRDDTEENTQRTTLVSGYSQNVYGISTGWAFDFPWIETMTIKESDGSTGEERPVYLHFGSKGTMAIEATAEENGQDFTITGLTSYDYEDVKLDNFNQTVDGIPCRYRLRDKTGFRTYFNADGVVVLQKDAHDNTITYTYRNKIYFDRITDSVGREIKFIYKEPQNGLRFLDKVTVQGTKVAGGVSQKIIRYEIGQTSYTTMNNKKIYGCVLNCVTAGGGRETYRYRTVESLVNAAGAGVASQRAATNETYLMESVESDGSIDHYEYRAGAVRGTRDTGAGQKRDVVTQFFYVTREYEQDAKTKKKANGIKYDYFQKQDGKLVTFADLDDEKHEAWQYGEDGLETLTIVSSFNPKKYKDKKKMSDYTYKKASIDAGTMQLKQKPKKSVYLYRYNTNKLLMSELSDGKNKSETLYSYDKEGKGSLVMLETEKNYGTNRSKSPKETKQGYTYDRFRNVLTETGPKAYLKKYKGKESLFTQTNTYFHTTDGYPKEDRGYTLCTAQSYEDYSSPSTKMRILSTLAPNGIDVASDRKQIQRGNQPYQTLSRTEFTYDDKGNERTGKEYPDCLSDPASYIEGSYEYNQLGQRLKQDMTLFSAGDSSQNRSFTQEKATFDSFGNELTYTDQKGLVTRMTYQEDTGEEDTTIAAAGTPYEEKEQSYLSEDGSASMRLDAYGRCTVEINDAFGNTIIRKDERAGTWTESEYDYGTEGTESEDETEEPDQVGVLVEERVYPFEPEDEPVTKASDGSEEVHYDLGGKGAEVLEATRYIYDEYGNEIVTAAFSGGAIDAAHCASWTVDWETEEVSGEQSVTTSHHKELNPAAYQKEVDKDQYQTQFDDHILSETVQTSVIDEEGNLRSQTSIVRCDGKIQEIVSTYEQDAFGQTISDHTTRRKYQSGGWLQTQETKNTYEYDDFGNNIRTTTQSRLSETDSWETQTTKAVYDQNGNLTESYTPRGVSENYATRYAYDLQGQTIKEWRPVSRKNGETEYQLIQYTYDDSGNVIAKEEQLTEKETARTEYTYNERGELICVKSCAEDGRKSDTPSLYAQYVYDAEGNKIRQFTGMTEPLTITLKEGEGRDSCTYAGKTVHIEVSGGNKKDSIRETKYTYNKKNQLISLTDPEGNKETYTYDVYGNQTEVADKKGNTTTYTYDYQGRMLTKTVKDVDTKNMVTHSRHYDVHGNLDKEDGVAYTYDRLTGQIEKEKETIAGKEVEKVYTYDSGDNCRSFDLSVGGKNQLSLSYEYDGFSRLSHVRQQEGGKSQHLASYSYDEDGSLITGRVGEADDLVTDYTYDFAGNVTKLTNKNETGHPFSQYTGTYRLNGQKISEREVRETKEKKTETKEASYTYDTLGRLRTESHTGEQDITYAYDPNGNRKTMTQGHRVTAYKYNKNEELIRTDTLNTNTNQDTVVVYKNDRNGNQLAVVHRKKIEGSGPYFNLDITVGRNRINPNTVYHYDPENRMCASLAGKNTTIYTYDADGYRKSKKVNKNTTYYIWDGDQIVMELNQKGKVTKRYIRGNSLICSDTGEGTEKTYFVTNPHGDVVQLLNEQGAVTREYSYDAFGKEKKPDQKDTNPYRYAGEYYDKETDSIYLRARYYTPSLGRFMTPDTYTGEESDPLSLHLYAYCDQDGVNQVDPSGHWGRKTHRGLTKAAYASYKNNKFKKDKYYDALLQGSVLPDFLKAKKDKKKDYKSLNKKKYRKYLKDPLLDIPLWSKDKEEQERIENTFHGKNKIRVNILQQKAKNAIVKPSHKEQKWEKYLLIGCVLHTIQDYSAHSYVGDLETFKGSAPYKQISQKDRIYHMEWDTYFSEKYKIDNNTKLNKDEKDNMLKALGNKRDEMHTRTKDNANMTFVYGRNNPYLDFRVDYFLSWHWHYVHSKEDNVRYIEAKAGSTDYLPTIIKYVN